MAFDHTARLRCGKTQHERWIAHAQASGYDDFSSWARRVLDAVMKLQQSALISHIESLTDRERAVLVALLRPESNEKP